MSGINVDSAVRQATQVQEKLNAVMAKWMSLIVMNTESTLAVPLDLALEIGEALGLATGFMTGLIAAAKNAGYSPKPPV